MSGDASRTGYAGPAMLAWMVVFAWMLVVFVPAMVAGESAHEGDPKETTPHPRWNGPGYRGPAIPPAGDAGGVVVPLAGAAGGTEIFPASGISLLSWVPLSEFSDGSWNANDCWGYVSPSGREYAIVGLEKSTGFVEVTDPANPVVVAVVPDSMSLWSDVEVYGRYCLNVNEKGGGLQVMDLGAIDEGVVSMAAWFGSPTLRTVHTLHVNPASGYVYLNGSNMVNGGLVAVNLADPANPVIAGTWPHTYVHDCIARSYTSGPWAGREIVFAACGTMGLFVIDVTDKSSMSTIAQYSYPQTAFCHNGWLDPEGRYLYLNDEFDERFYLTTTTTIVMDVSDIYTPQFVGKFGNGNTAVDHNPMGRGGFLYEANYRSGLRVYDITSPVGIHEVAWFDTWPSDDQAEFNGAWSTYVGLPSGIILVSDIERGLFVLAHGATTTVPAAPASQASVRFRVSPNPVREEGTFHFSFTEPSHASLRIVDVRGREVAALGGVMYQAGLHSITWRPDPAVPPGVYFAEFRTGSYQETKRVVLAR